MGRSRVRIDFLMAILHFVYKQFRQPRVAIQKFHFKLNAPAREEAKLPPTKLLWFGGYPAHYMGEFHRQLEARYEDLFFVYLRWGSDGPAFAHESTRLPKKYVLLPQYFQFLSAWRWLGSLDPQAVLITGNFPRANLVAACWAFWHSRELYYLADSNLLDQRNLRRKSLNTLFLQMFLRRATKFEAVEASVRDPFVFMVFGRLEPIKSVDRVIAAYALLEPAMRQRSRLLIVGDGSMRLKLEALVAELGLVDKVEFRGAIASDKAPGIYGEASALVIASQDEPWGLVVNEALSAGKPVVGPFWIGAFADLVIPGKTGLVTMGNAPEQLAVAMRQLLSNPLTADVMGQTGRMHVREQGWTIDGSVHAFASLLANLDKSS
jgi:glycosyltransferase involved in cell wall biosynthesis